MVKVISAVGKHKQVYTDIHFGSFQWSPDGQHLVYIAEQNPPKVLSFFEKEESGKIEPGSKFELQESWGEAFAESLKPRIFLVNVETEDIWEAKGIPDHYSTGQVQWSPDGKGVVFVGWNTAPQQEPTKSKLHNLKLKKKLGIIYCTNRDSALYYLAIDETKGTNTSNNIVKLTSVARARSPRFTPDGKKIVFLSPLDDMDTHSGPSRLFVLDWETKQSKLITDIVSSPKTPQFPGIFTDILPRSCFIDPSKVVLHSSYYSSSALLCISLENGNVEVLLQNGAQVLDASPSGKLLISHSLSNQLPSIKIGRVEKDKIEWRTVDGSSKMLPVSSKIEELALQVFPLTIPDVPHPIEYFLISPPNTSKSSGLILFPHGGPHTCSDTNFFPLRAFFGLLNYHVLVVNYRGSNGFGLDALNSLLGHIGEHDVNDCVDALTDVLKKFPDIDKDKIFYYGGSHGGFMGCHLASKEKRIRAIALYNPVTNIASMTSTTDIPDWCYTECDVFEYSASAVQKMFSLSPVSALENIRTPILFVLGEKDLRVPPHQGIHLHQLLKERGIPTRLLIYPGEGHAIEKPEHLADVWINTILWFQQHAQ
uniref:Acylamino-acid-releasing enzyme n=1 Tax=Arcella intermedia TaxID=1963864 RepID=A0A6B2KZY8_9EUKA